MKTLTYLHQIVFPAMYALLPPVCASREASAMLLAIGLQESQFLKRRQMGGGPARGFWQFERDGGISGVLAHHQARPLIGPVLGALCYPVYADTCYAAVEHNDVLAASFARCLLWTVPDVLPTRDEPDRGWAQYLTAWRPGKPHPETWPDNYRQAWTVVES